MADEAAPMRVQLRKSLNAEFEKMFSGLAHSASGYAKPARFSTSIGLRYRCDYGVVT
jgi:hypothetical protein